MKQSIFWRVSLTASLAIALLLTTTNFALATPTEPVQARVTTAEWNPIQPLFTSSPDTWVQTAKLTASNGQAGDWFGRTVLVTPELIVVGVPDSGYAQPTAGAVYVFERSSETGQITQVAILTASDAASFDEFGFSVAMSGDTIVVGAFRDDVVATDSGAAYVFERPAGGWGACGSPCHQTAKLTATGGASFDNFGVSVGISEDTIVVGAYFKDVGATDSGAAYVFEKPVGGWMNMTQTARLTASDAASSDQFGRAVTINGHTIVIGAFMSNAAGIDSGSAYVFERPLSGWVNMTQTAKLIGSDTVANDKFGFAVSLRADTLVVGAFHNDSNATNAGAAYVFMRPVGGWVNSVPETAKLTASDGMAGDEFGLHLQTDGENVVVGAWKDGHAGAESGSAYVFMRPEGGWVNMTETDKLTADDAQEEHWFGRDVAIWGDTVVMGAPGDGVDANFTGAAYVFGVPISELTAVNDSPTTLGYFTHLTATVNSGNNITYTWNLGDGTIASGDILSHTYPAIGTYTATVTATNSISQLTGTTIITITDVPVGGLILANDSPTVLDNATQLTATVSSGTNVTFTWDLGDGTTASGDMLSHTYPAIGTYTATVTATNSVSQLTGTTVVTITAMPSTSSFIYLPLVVRPFALQIGRPSPTQPVAQQGNVYYIDTVQIPAQLPTGGQFYLSGSSTEVVPVIVDDRLTLGVNGQAIFTQDFGQPPTGLVIQLEAATVAQMAGQTVTVIYQDVYGDQQGATAVWLVWVP